MSKWRPSDSCLYVIPDIHGMYDELDLILKRILPLRRTGGSMDMLIFLGDYVDRRIDSHKVIDLLIKTKQEAPDQVINLLGNHELMLLEAIQPDTSIQSYNMWMCNGGEETFMGYLQRANSEIENPYLISRNSIKRFFPDKHIKFIESLLPYYENDNYIFVHGGCDPFIPLQNQEPKVLVWDRSVYIHMLNLAENKIRCPWNKTIVTGHNGEPEGKTFIYDKYMMLDRSPDEKLYVWELNSKTGFYSQVGNKRLVKESIT